MFQRSFHVTDPLTNLTLISAILFWKGVRWLVRRVYDSWESLGNGQTIPVSSRPGGGQRLMQIQYLVQWLKFIETKLKSERIVRVWVLGQSRLVHWSSLWPMRGTEISSTNSCVIQGRDCSRLFVVKYQLEKLNAWKIERYSQKGFGEKALQRTLYLETWGVNLFRIQNSASRNLVIE